ncbi:MAG: hypothetical protein ICV77_08125 [Cyanobacteria bacterium Co-bin8]|nr:hypothetical protein [Cyanobacteria bacterium Co-bin8]
MDEWSKQFFRSLGTASQDAEQWLQQVAQHLAEASDSFVQVTDEWSDQVQQAIEPELERIIDNIGRQVEPWEEAVGSQVEDVADRLEQVLDPLLTPFVSGIGLLVETITAPINSTVEPMLQNHPVCVGCRNYCGRAYGDNMLVCAMHPYGPEAETCEDWESIWPNYDSNG